MVESRLQGLECGEFVVSLALEQRSIQQGHRDLQKCLSGRQRQESHTSTSAVLESRRKSANKKSPIRDWRHNVTPETDDAQEASGKRDHPFYFLFTSLPNKFVRDSTLMSTDNADQQDQNQGLYSFNVT